MLFLPSRYDMDTLIKFTLTVRKNYRPVPYHNWTHAFSVAHAMYTILKTTKNVFSPLEVCATIAHRYFEYFIQKTQRYYSEPMCECAVFSNIRYIIRNHPYVSLHERFSPWLKCIIWFHLTGSLHANWPPARVKANYVAKLRQDPWLIHLLSVVLPKQLICGSSSPKVIEACGHCSLILPKLFPCLHVTPPFVW